MPRKTIILCITLMLCSVSSKDPVQAQARSTRPNDFGIELLGNGLVGSFSYQRMITPLVGLQVGFFGSSETQVIIPLGGQRNYTRRNASPFATGGIVLWRSSDATSGPIDTEIFPLLRRLVENSDPIETESIPYVGLGYEVRSNGGFFYSATLYALFLNEEQVLSNNDADWPLPMVGRVIVWPGLYFGYAF